MEHFRQMVKTGRLYSGRQYEYEYENDHKNKVFFEH